MAKYIPPEKIWERYKNRYEVIIRAADLVRELLAEESEGRTETSSDSAIKKKESIYIQALKRILSEKPKDEKR